MRFSIVMPVKNEYELLHLSLPSCYSLNPDEVLLCFDDPPHTRTVNEAKRIARQFFQSYRTKIVSISRNDAYAFQQAWVRREGFRRASYDRILTTDVDLIVNANVLKAVSLVGKDGVGLASCVTLHTVSGLLGLWRSAGHLIGERFGRSGIAGLYALWRPYWMDSEDNGIERLENVKNCNARGSLVLIGEDVYLRNCIQRKHLWVHLRTIGAYNIREDCPDNSHVQFELGRYYFERGEELRSVLARAIALARPSLISGYLYQRRTREPIPTYDYDTYPY